MRGIAAAEFNPFHIFLLSMTKILTPLLICLLIASGFAQTVNLSAVFTNATLATLGSEYQNPDFLKLINNYFGCKTWQNGSCIECSASYLFNKNGVCCLIDQNCQQFNRDMGVCELCYTGFIVSSNGSCTQQTLFQNDQTNGCAEWTNNVCNKCSVKYYMYSANSSKSYCKAVSDDCRDWNTTTGECTQCYRGYSLVNGSCLLDNSPPTTVANNPNCKTWNNSDCIECALRAYFDAKRICQLVSTQCWTWDSLDGLCLSCYKGYDLVNGSCVYSPSNTAAVTDPGCKTWNNTTCIQCSSRWVFNTQNVCIPVNDLCRTNDQNGVCVTCYYGYTLVNGSCEYIPDNVTDLGCGKWSWNNKTCVSCSEGWVFDSNGICAQVKDICRTHDDKGLCTACYVGYELAQDGTCLLSNNYQTVQDQGCKIWNYESNICKECSAWWFLNVTSGTCLQVNPLCQAYAADGSCSSCYKGYDLTSGVCTVSPIAAPSDLGCKTWNKSVCVQCSDQWVFNALNVCVEVSDLCKTHDGVGNCLTCYVGYAVVNGSCVFTTEKVTDPGCKQWDWNNKICKTCSFSFVFDSNGNCAPVSDQCKTYNATNGFCTSCYKGYELSETFGSNNATTSVSCVFAPSNNVGPSDLGCKIWDWDNNTCSQCSQNWYFNADKHCAQVSPYCASSDAATGLCLSCYLGYDLSNGTCIYSSSNTAPPSDLGCKTWKGAVCTECSFGWEFNSQNKCIAVSDLCKTHQGNLCTSCFNGYVLVNGTCQVSPLNSIIPTDAGCKTWDWNAQKCLECSSFWYFVNGVCAPVSDLCKTYDNSTGLCLSCFKGYALTNGSCVAQDTKVTDAGCGTWDWDNNKCLKCGNYWYFNVDGVCSAVSPYCKTYDPATGACTTCFSGYALSNGVCSLSVNLCKSSDSTGCLSCYDGFALYQKKCISLDNIANIALYYAECCPQKLADLQAAGRIPQ